MAEMDLRQPRFGLENYIRLIQSFVDGEISAPTFKGEYLKLVKNDPVVRDDATFNVIDELFFYVDEYFDDPDFAEQEKRDEDEKLCHYAENALKKLKQLSVD